MLKGTIDGSRVALRAYLVGVGLGFLDQSYDLKEKTLFKSQLNTGLADIHTASQ